MDAVIPEQTRWKVCTFACKALYGKQYDRVMKKVKKNCATTQQHHQGRGSGLPAHSLLSAGRGRS